MATLPRLEVMDKVVTIAVKDGNGAALNLNNYPVSGATLQVGNFVIQKYTYPAKTGYKTLKVVNLLAGLVDMNIFREDEFKAPAGNVFYNFYVYETESDFLDDKFKTVADAVEIYTLNKNPNLKTNDGY